MNRRRAAVVLFCVAELALPQQVAAVSLLDILLHRTNWSSCLDFRIEGTCVDPVALAPGILVSYRLPHVLQDTVKILGNSTIDELQVSVATLSSLIGGGGALGNTGEWNLQYSEVHIAEWPMQMALASHAVPIPEELWCRDHMQYGGGLTVNYLSELDAAAWRANLLPEGFNWWVGVWAPLSPRIGWCTHHSPSVASAVFGFRGVHLASLPGVHVVLKPLWFPLDLGDDRMQLAVPKVRECLEVGTNPLVWDHNVVALDGQYLWIYWHRVRCCVSGSVPGPLPGLFVPR